MCLNTDSPSGCCQGLSERRHKLDSALQIGNFPPDGRIVNNVDIGDEWRLLNGGPSFTHRRARKALLNST